MENSLHEMCVEVVNKMVQENITNHISYISGEDNIFFGLKEGGKIPKVTIEWVEEDESYPNLGEPGYDVFIANHTATEKPQSNSHRICSSCHLPIVRSCSCDSAEPETASP